MDLGGFGQLADEFCKCFDITMASTSGSDIAGEPKFLQAMPPVNGMKCSVLNADLGTHMGNSRAQNLGFMTTVVPDIISSPFLPEIASLFTSEHRGRLIGKSHNLLLKSLVAICLVECNTQTI